MPGLAALFFQQQHALDAHAAVHRLAHVVNREQAYADCGQGLHFNAGSAQGFDRNGERDAAVGGIGFEFGTHPRQCQRVRQRNQIRGALCRLDRGEAGHAEHVAFFCGARLDQAQGRRLHAYAAAGAGDAARFRLGAYVDHVRLAARVEMGQLFRLCRGTSFHSGVS